LGAVLFGSSAAALVTGGSAIATAAPPSYQHVFLIVEENNGFGDIIGNPAAPNFNAYANTFGLATKYYGVNGTSEPNYVGLLGGSTFGLSSDDAYWTNTVNAPDLMSQLDQAGLSWKAYLQGLPHPGYQDICYPAKCNGAPDSDPLYVSKHDGIQNFTTSRTTSDWANQVPIDQLSSDISSGSVPRFSYIVPDECHDMHGDPPYCLDSGFEGDAQNQHLIAVGDQYLGNLVSQITHAAFWSQGNNAIAVTFDSGTNTSGCCDANPGGGRVPTVVITSHGPRGVTDNTPSNEFSMLSTMQNLFGLGCLQNTCDTTNVKPLLPLFAVNGSAPIATSALTPPKFATPTPTPNEPIGTTKSTPSAGGWTVQQAQRLGGSDNSLGAVAASSPTDVWAVGNFLPDDVNANRDATLTLAEHYDGASWSVVPTPNTGVNFNSFYGVAASQGQAWAVGTYLDAQYDNRALVEVWNGSQWTIANVPQPGALRDQLFGAAASSPSDVWSVGDQEGSDGVFHTLAEHWDGNAWSVVPTPDPGSNGDLFYGVTTEGPNDAWAVGQQLGSAGPDQVLVEHWDGSSWSVVSTPAVSGGTAMLNGVAASGSDVWAVGQVDSPDGGGRPLAEVFDGTSWQIASLPASAGSNWTSLWGVASSPGGVWAVGSFVDPTSDNNQPLLLQDVGGTWTVVNGPVPGSGANILGGVTSVGNDLWAAGVYDNGKSGLPLVETHTSP
jgi:hypothetical protein